MAESVVERMRRERARYQDPYAYLGQERQRISAGSGQSNSIFRESYKPPKPVVGEVLPVTHHARELSPREQELARLKPEIEMNTLRRSIDATNAREARLAHRNAISQMAGLPGQARIRVDLPRDTGQRGYIPVVAQPIVEKCVICGETKTAGHFHGKHKCCGKEECHLTLNFKHIAGVGKWD